MRRILLSILVIGLFAVQANADLWQVDKSEALNFTSYTGSSGDNVGDLGLYDGRVLDYTFVGSPAPTYNLNGDMSGQVGLSGTLRDDNGGGVLLDVYDDSPSLSSLTTYDGISMYVENDNQSNWNYQLYYDIGSTEYTSGDFVTLAPGASTWLSTAADLKLGDITRIGFRIQSPMDGQNGFASTSDTFYTSVVPVPAAVILGILGLGVVGIKLRKYA
jgi:hypothetical protein